MTRAPAQDASPNPVTASPNTESRIGPTDPRSRIKSVDIVRGFALFGVLLVNMYNFGAYSPEWTGSIDRFFFGVMHGVFETKSWRLFSMLFGFGFFLQMQKAARYKGNFLVVYVRRLVILFVIGMAHALFYDGDILMEYAILGLVLIPFRRMPPRLILGLAVALMTVFPIGNAYVSATESAQPADDEGPASLAERRDGHPYLGSVEEVMKANAEAIPPRIFSGLHNPESSLAIFAMFLLGLYVGRRRILSDIPSHLSLIRKTFWWGLTIGISCMVGEILLSRFLGYAVFRAHDASIAVQFLGDTLFAFGSTALSLGYAAGIVVLVQNDRWQEILKPLGSLGRLALTVYLSGTAMFTLLFYGYGFGQLFLLGPAVTTAIAVIFFAIQLLFCVWWTKRFRFGPFEWAWRTMTYLEWQPLAYSEIRRP